MIPPIQHEYGIVTLDADYLRPGLAAIHMMVENGRVAVIDTGTNNSLPMLLAELKHLGLSTESVDYIIVTHVHLDHAGGAGALLRDCPNARLVVHPKGARHLVDPAKLVAGSIEVYGHSRFLDLYGEIVPAAPERVIEAEEGFTLDFNGRTLRFLDTPGHARHHFCVYDALSESLFTGDTFGISYREFDVEGRPFVFPTTTPVQFDPAALHTSIERLLSLNAKAAFLTHYGRITGLAGLAPHLHELIDAFVQMTLDAPGEGDARKQALKASMYDLLLSRLLSHGCELDELTCRELLAGDVELNVQGLLFWRDHRSS